MQRYLGCVVVDAISICLYFWLFALECTTQNIAIVGMFISMQVTIHMSAMRIVDLEKVARQREPGDDVQSPS